MFGYIRPYKPELLIRQWTYYKAAYCGLCKQISAAYGQLPRLALTYDVTFLVIFLQSLAAEPAHLQLGTCLINPVKKKLIVAKQPLLEYAAAVSVILAYYKGQDDISDGQSLKGRLVSLAFASACKKAAQRYPKLHDSIKHHLQELSVCEKKETNIEAGHIFGRLLADVFSLGLDHINLSETDFDLTEREISNLKKSVDCFGDELGQWIYYLDAIDDYAADKQNGSWNPFWACTETEAQNIAEELLGKLEDSLDKTAELLPFVRDSGLIANVLQLGLPQTRQDIFNHLPLEKL